MERGVLLKSGIINQNVDRPEVLNHLREHCFYLVFAANISLDRDSITAILANCFDHAIPFGGIGKVVHCNRRASCAQGKRASLTDAGTRTGDEGFLIFEKLPWVDRVAGHINFSLSNTFSEITIASAFRF